MNPTRRLFLTSLPCALARTANWPNWRGPGNHGVADEHALPLTWSKTENVKWRTPLPEPGNSTPIVWGDRVFVTQSLEKQGRRQLMCFSRKEGKLLWQSGVPYAEKERSHRTNAYCSASPVTDGKAVYCWFGSAGLAAYDMQGRELWRRDLGRQDHVWGYGASPILHGDLLILNFGPGNPSFLIAVNASDGKTAWRFELPTALPADDVTRLGELKPRSDGAVRADFFGSWTTPLLVRAANRDELVFNLPRRVAAFDPASGKQLWWCEGFADLAYGSPVLAPGDKGPLIVSLGGFGGPGLLVRAGGNGDVTSTHRIWHQPKTRPRIGSSVVHEGHIHTVDIQGIAECLDLASGAPVWTERLRGKGGTNAIWSSPIRHRSNLYVMNQSGDTFVYKAAPKFELLAVNSLEEDTNSTVVPSGGEIFLRTHEALWCIAERKSA